MLKILYCRHQSIFVVLVLILVEFTLSYFTELPSKFSWFQNSLDFNRVICAGFFTQKQFSDVISFPFFLLCSLFDAYSHMKEQEATTTKRGKKRELSWIRKKLKDRHIVDPNVTHCYRYDQINFHTWTKKNTQNEKKTQDIFGACFTLSEVKRWVIVKWVFFIFLKQSKRCCCSFFIYSNDKQNVITERDKAVSPETCLCLTCS